MSTHMLKTEFEFTLPRGYVDTSGDLHCAGLMRLATALDEVEPLRDERVRQNESYLSVLLLSRVVTRLGKIHPVPAAVIEGLFASDFSYLQSLYVRVNELGTEPVETQCPGCGRRFALDLLSATKHGSPD